jgi:hypothetical protein
VRSQGLPRLMVWLASLLAPERNAAYVIAELEDDYAIARAQRSAPGAALWLVCETGSLLVA